MRKPKEPIRFRNYYRCSECANEWFDEWSCTCNDKCPNCNTEIEPYHSDDLEETGDADFNEEYRRKVSERVIRELGL